VRILGGPEPESYNNIYKEAQQLIETGTRATLDARARAFLLLKRHGQEICKRKKPKCEECVVSSSCAYFGG